MNTSDTRVTREQAAEQAGVSERQINRWAQAGIITTFRPDGPYGRAFYDPAEVRAAPAKWRKMQASQRERRRAVASVESDIST